MHQKSIVNHGQYGQDNHIDYILIIFYIIEFTAISKRYSIKLMLVLYQTSCVQVPKNMKYIYIVQYFTSTANTRFCEHSSQSTWPQCLNIKTVKIHYERKQ